MKRLILSALILLMTGLSFGAESITPLTARRVLDALELAEQDPAAALAELARLAERARRDEDIAFVVGERAALLIQEEQLDTALTELEATLAGKPPGFAPRVRYLYATTLLMSDEFPAALAQLEIWAAELEEPAPIGLFLIGYLHVRMERYDKAIDAIERAIASANQVRDQWVEVLSYAYTRAGRTDEAIELLEQLIAKKPDQQRWWRQLAGIFMLVEKMQEGGAALAVSHELEALSYREQRRLARLFAHLGAPTDGAIVLQAAIEASEEPVDFEDRMLLGELWMLAREFEYSLTAFEQAAAIAPDGEPAMLIGQLHAQREDYDAARGALTSAVAAYGEEVPAQLHYLLAIVEINLGNFEAASRSVVQLVADDKYAARGERLGRYIANAMATGN